VYAAAHKGSACGVAVMRPGARRAGGRGPSAQQAPVLAAQPPTTPTNTPTTPKPPTNLKPHQPQNPIHHPSTPRPSTRRQTTPTTTQTPAGHFVATVGTDRGVLGWDLNTCTQASSYSVSKRGRAPSWEQDGFACSASGSAWARVCAHVRAFVCARVSAAAPQHPKTPKPSPQGADGVVNDAAFTQDGRRLLAACGDKRILCWDFDTARSRHTLTGHGGAVLCVAASALDASVAVSAGEDRCVKARRYSVGGSCLRGGAHMHAPTAIHEFAQTHSHARTHTRTHMHTHTSTHTHKHKHTHTPIQPPQTRPRTAPTGVGPAAGLLRAQPAVRQDAVRPGAVPRRDHHPHGCASETDY
jgi:hypothetical protein